MYHSIKVILIFQMCLIETNQLQIIEVILFYLESWNNRNLQLSLTRELVSEQRLTRTIIVVFPYPGTGFEATFDLSGNCSLLHLRRLKMIEENYNYRTSQSLLRN